MLSILGKIATVVIYFGLYSVNRADGRSNPTIGYSIELQENYMEMEEGHHRITRRTLEKMNICGPRLRQAIEYTCKNSRLSYYSPDQSSFRHSDNLETSEGSRLHTETANNLSRQKTPGPKIIRLSRSVIDECCNKPCSRSVLLKYCDDIEPKDNPTVSTTTAAPSPTKELRNPRQETHSSRKQQRKRSRVRINVPEDSSLDNSRINVVECLLDADCLANLKLNVPTENTMPTETANSQQSASNRSHSCANSPRSKGNRKRSRSSRKKKLEARIPSYLLPLLLRLIGYGLNGQSEWQEAYPFQSVARSRFDEGDNAENKINGRPFSNLDYYQRKPFLQKTTLEFDETTRDGINSGNLPEQWEEREITGEGSRESAYSASPTDNEDGRRAERPAGESYRRRVLPVTDAPFLSYFAVNLGTNDGINYQQRK